MRPLKYKTFFEGRIKEIYHDNLKVRTKIAQAVVYDASKVDRATTILLYLIKIHITPAHPAAPLRRPPSHQESPAGVGHPDFGAYM